MPDEQRHPMSEHKRAIVADHNILSRAKSFLVERTDSKSSHWLGDREQ